jgi:hypothetical protein
MKCSHTFNLLDARGAISVTERAAYIGRVRALAREVAQAYHDSRQALGFPMCKGQAPGGNEMNDTVLIELRSEELPPKSLKTCSPKPSPTAFFPPSSAGVRCRGQRVHALRHPAPAGADDHRGCRPAARPRAGKERPGGCRCARRSRPADQSPRGLHARCRGDFRTAAEDQVATARASTSLPARKEGRGALLRTSPRSSRRRCASCRSKSHALGRLRAPVRAPGAQPDPPARRRVVAGEVLGLRERSHDDGPPLPGVRRDRHRPPGRVCRPPGRGQGHRLLCRATGGDRGATRAPRPGQLDARINPAAGLLDEVTALVEWPAVYVGEFEPSTSTCRRSA